MTVIGLLRHGPTAWNREKLIQGVRDIPLDLAAFDPRPWQDLLDRHGPWERIVSSPLSRARETASLLFPDRSVTLDAGLREQDWGLWTGRTLKELRREFPGSVEEQEALGWDFTPPGGESRRQVLARALDSVRGAAAESGRILLVTHLGVIKILINHLLDSPFLPAQPVPVEKRALHLLSLEHGRLSILQTNVKHP